MPVIALKTACVAVLDSPAHHSFGGTSGTSATTRKELAIASHKLVEEEVEKDDDIAWTPLHASVHNLPTKIHVALTQLLSLFYEKAAPAAITKHGMDVQYQATEFLNPGQISAYLDAPLYATAKCTQFNAR